LNKSFIKASPGSTQLPHQKRHKPLAARIFCPIAREGEKSMSRQIPGVTEQQSGSACSTTRHPNKRLFAIAFALSRTIRSHPGKIPLVGWGKKLLLVAAMTLGLSLLVGCSGQPASDDFVTIGSEGQTLTLNDGAKLTFLPEGMSGSMKLRANTIAREKFLSEGDTTTLKEAAQQLPSNLSPASDLYYFETNDGAVSSKIVVSLPLPEDTGLIHNLDLFTWDGVEWSWQPHQFDVAVNATEAQLGSLPVAMALMRRESTIPVISADIQAETELPEKSEGSLTELLLTGFSVQPDGSIAAGSITPQLVTTAQLIPSAQNWRTDGSLSVSIGDILADPAWRQRHLDALVGLAMAGGYPAVQLDYRIQPGDRELLNAFITDLAAALHKQNRKLLVRVAEPNQISNTDWDTGGFDWFAIGQSADRIQFPVSLSPERLAQGQIETLLNWAAGQVDRAKLQPVLSLQSWATVDGPPINSTSIKTLGSIGPLEASTGTDPINPDTDITLSLSGLSPQKPKIDPISGMVQLTGADVGGQVYQILLIMPTSLEEWVQRTTGYQLAGVMLDHLFVQTPGDQTWEVLHAYRNATKVNITASEPVWVWTVSDLDSGNTIVTEKRQISEVGYTWRASNGGNFKIELGLSPDGGQTTVPVASLNFQVESSAAVSKASDLLGPSTPPEASPTAPATPSPTPPPTSTPLPTATPTLAPPPPTATPLPSNNCPDSRAAITYPVNGMTIRGIVPFMGTANLDNLKYYKIEYRPAGTPTWQFLTEVNYTWVRDDKLMEWHTNTVAPGTYDVRMLVIDMTGNYPPPCEIQVTITR
jgi:hypothetical protein